jgi:chaperonin GroES
MSSYRPLSNKLLVKPDPEKDKTEGGIILVASDKEKPRMGTVLSVGRGTPIVTEQGSWSIVPLECQPDNRILFPPDVGVPLNVDGEDCLLLIEDQVLAIIG